MTLLALSLVTNFQGRGEQQYSYLAQSFLQGKTYFLEPPDGSWADATYHDGRYYYPPGPFPVILLMPFTFIANQFNIFFFQGYLQFFLVLITFFVVYKVALKMKLSSQDSVWIAIAFCCASPFLGVALWPWRSYMGHVITVLLIFIALLEYLGKKRYWIIGVLFAGIIATRSTAVFGISFFIIQIIFGERTTTDHKARQLLTLSGPILLSIALLGWYNHVNYGNALESGYATEISLFPSFLEAMKFGIISVSHIPTNLYYALMASPIPITHENTYVLRFPYIRANPWGMGIFLTSPYLIWLVLSRLNEPIVKNLLLTSVIIAISVLSIYATGFRQFGYRYSLDFLPYIFLILIIHFRSRHEPLPKGLKLSIALSSLFDLFMFFTFIKYS